MGFANRKKTFSKVDIQWKAKKSNTFSFKKSYQQPKIFLHSIQYFWIQIKRQWGKCMMDIKP